MGFAGIVAKEKTNLDAGGTGWRIAGLAGHILGVIGLIPGIGAFEAFRKKDGGLVAEEFLGEADVGEGIADVALAGRLVFGLQSFAGGFLKHFENPVEGNGVARADIEGSPRGAGGFAGENVGLHGVFDIGEVASLFAVAEHDRWDGIEEGGGKTGEHARIGRVWILARAEYIEITQADIFKAVAAAKGLGVEFADVFGYAVGRNGHRLHVFGFWQGRSVAIGRGRGGEDNALHFVVAGGDQDIQGAINVDAIGVNGILDRARDGSAGGEVNDVVGLDHGLLHDLDIGDRALHEGDFAAHFGEVVFLARRKIIEDDYAMAAAHEFVHCIRADKSGAAPNQVAHANASYRKSHLIVRWERHTETPKIRSVAQTLWGRDF